MIRAQFALLAKTDRAAFRAAIKAALLSQATLRDFYVTCDAAGAITASWASDKVPLDFLPVDAVLVSAGDAKLLREGTHKMEAGAVVELIAEAIK